MKPTKKLVSSCARLLVPFAWAYHLLLAYARLARMEKGLLP